MTSLYQSDVGDTPRLEFLGLAFARLTMSAVLARVAQRPAGDSFAYVVTPNVDHVVRLASQVEADPESRRLIEAYGAADLTLCDSRVLSLLARFHGLRLPVAPGSDLTAAVLDRVTEPGEAINIVGGSTDAVELLRLKYPHFKFQQHIPPMGMRTNPVAMQRAVDFVSQSPARFTFLAVGSPQQELLALEIKRAGRAQGVGFCVGASIDFIVGKEKRAPLLVQKSGLEWLYRLFRNPGRMWRRYLVEGPRIFLIAARWRPSTKGLPKGSP